MLQDRATCTENYIRFVERAKQSREVWGLKSDEGWANAPSNEIDDADVLVFWSDRAYAVRQAKGDWKRYKPTAIPLDAFLANWLPGMHKEKTMVGPNWDATLCGLEVEPLEMLRKFKEM